MGQRKAGGHWGQDEDEDSQPGFEFLTVISAKFPSLAATFSPKASMLQGTNG